MKIVQTYWSAPATKNSKDDENGHNTGGWPSEKYHAFSRALSSLKFKQFYPERVLYVDKGGEDWLINKLGLYYSEVLCTLDSLIKILYCGLCLKFMFTANKMNRLYMQMEMFTYGKNSVRILSRVNY
jgi:hypothetical protein